MIRILAARVAGSSNCSDEGTAARASRDANQTPAPLLRGGRFAEAPAPVIASDSDAIQTKGLRRRPSLDCFAVARNDG